ncbi:hypothetical protein Fmac_001321 [Flemingia macrophylla]|uniref:Uncharacterized protein n=1 Tax=Flemingia macrophylla TaxID=520843 RepID=A0ABD1NGS4_9FABA
MQAVSVLPLSSKFRDSSDEFAESSGKFEHDFMAKLNIDEHDNENEEKRNQDEDVGDEENEEEEEEEFSFALANPDGSLISADDAFDNGQIRPVFPIFNQDLLFSDGYNGGDAPIKVFVQQSEESPLPSATEPTVAEGPYCEWTPKSAVKSNSTGFSKLWRLRDVKLRSNSDGKDTFVFLNHAPAAKAEKARNNFVVKKVETRKGKTTLSSAHERHYVLNRARKESDKRKSYLPYRQDLFGFFSNSNGLSRNVHPY